MTDTVTAPAPESAQPEAPKGKTHAQIAREVFGNEYKGPVEETAPTEEPKPVDTEADEEIPLPEEPESEELEGETAPEETGETPIATLSELAEHFELDPDYVKTLKVPVNVDGTPTEATISDLIKSYQITEAAEHRLSDAKMVAQKESENWAAKHAALDAQFQTLAELIKHEEAVLEQDVKAIDPKLRDEDPAEWSARIQEFNQRRANIAQVKYATVEKYKTVSETRQRESDEIKN